MALLRLIGIAGLLLGVLAATPAVAQGRGDHDTPATQRQAETAGSQYGAPDCRTSADGWVMCRDNMGNWQRDGYDPRFGGDRWGYADGYGHGYSDGYRNSVVPPYAIVRNIRQSNFSAVSQPVLAGQFYQVKAIDPRGRKVKLYVDAHSGRIAKVKD